MVFAVKFNVPFLLPPSLPQAFSANRPTVVIYNFSPDIYQCLISSSSYLSIHLSFRAKNIFQQNLVTYVPYSVNILSGHSESSFIIQSFVCKPKIDLYSNMLHRSLPSLSPLIVHHHLRITFDAI